MIDISSIVHSGQPSQTLIAEWDAAMRSVGCAIVVGHGVDPAIGNELYVKAQEFFRHPVEEKLKYKTGKSFGAGCGYTPSGVEASSGTGQGVYY
jgi:isopenicillin N synthase-like dioxygenase